MRVSQKTTHFPLSTMFGIEFFEKVCVESWFLSINFLLPLTPTPTTLESSMHTESSEAEAFSHWSLPLHLLGVDCPQRSLCCEINP